MRASRLDRRIDILREVETGRDGLNAKTKAWAPLTARPIAASKEDVQDGERFRASETGAVVTTRFQIRWSTKVADVDSRDRVRFGGREYDISAVKEIGRREGLEITGAARAERA
jgi:SPP1 family predicted phage head-tail adaptor